MTPRTVIVTGSARGIGKATLELLRSQGHRAIGLDLSDAEVTADLATPAGRDAAVAAINTACSGTLDAVVACAGLAGSDTDATIAVNFFGTVALIEGVHPLLAKGTAARVVAISSSSILLDQQASLVEACLAGDEAAAKALGKDDFGRTYFSTKAALSRWVRRTAILPEWAGSGILLNAVAPGTVRTRITEPILATAEGRASLAKFTPIAVHDYAVPADIAPMLAFLASAENRYVVGQTIFIDGGTEVLLRGEDGNT